MTAPAPPAMSDKTLDEIEARWNAYIAGNATARADMAAMIREVRRLRAQPAGVVVPVEIVRWLLGEGDDFECPPEQFFRGKPAPYFWRKRLREAVADQLAALKKDPAP